MKSFIALTLIAALGFSSVGCQTTYDAYGNPRNSVDPGAAVAGAAAAGVLGYAISKNRNNNRNNHYNRGYDRGYRNGGGYYDRRGYYNHY